MTAITQSQAGEPEVVAWLLIKDQMAHMTTSDIIANRDGYAPLITMQSHREAMAPLEADRQKLRRIEAALKIKGGDEHYPTEWAYIQACNTIEAQKETIASDRAALQACVEAMLAGAKIIRNMGLGLTTMNHQERDPESGLNQLRAAITQAQEALK